MATREGVSQAISSQATNVNLFFFSLSLNFFCDSNRVQCGLSTNGEVVREMMLRVAQFLFVVACGVVHSSQEEASLRASIKSHLQQASPFFSIVEGITCT